MSPRRAASARTKSCRSVTRAESVRQHDLCEIAARLVQRGDVPNAAYEGARALLGQIFQSGITGGAIGAGHANLDEFVVMQGARCFRDHTRGHAGIADQDYGLQGVGETAQVPPLFFGKLHRRDCSGLHELAWLNVHKAVASG